MESNLPLSQYCTLEYMQCVCAMSIVFQAGLAKGQNIAGLNRQKVRKVKNHQFILIKIAYFEMLKLPKNYSSKT